MKILFLIAALIAVVSTGLAVTRRTALHALLYLIVSFLSVGFIFLLLGAPFAAIMEVIIFAGAILVLFVFVVMLLNLGKTGDDQEKQLLPFWGWVAPLMLAFILLVELIFLLRNSGWDSGPAGRVGVKLIGKTLFGSYLLAVELVSFLLLAGLFSAYYLTRLKDLPENEGEKK